MSIVRHRGVVETSADEGFWARAGRARTKSYARRDNVSPKAAPKSKEESGQNAGVAILVAAVAILVTYAGIRMQADNVEAFLADTDNREWLGFVMLISASLIYIAYRFGGDGFLLIVGLGCLVGYGVYLMRPNWIDRWTAFVSGHTGVDPFWSLFAGWTLAVTVFARAVCPVRGRGLR